MLSVITGGPYSGKTTTIETLAAVGYPTATEVAIEIIRKRQERGEAFVPSGDRRAFQLAVMRRQLEQYAALRYRRAFFDRGIPDGIGYFLADELEPPPALVRAARECRYDRVFVLEPLGWPEDDRWREENPASQRKIHTSLAAAYRELDYRAIPVPVLGVRDRRDLILSFV